MENKAISKKYLWAGLIIVLIVGLIIGFLVRSSSMEISFAHKDMDGKRLEFIEEKDAIIGELMAQGDYACCLEKPCTYCIEKTPGHGEGAICNCLDDVVNGVHPCGECIGEILEGHGNRFLAPYFARSIAEEVGVEYLYILQKIISQKYDISIKEQI